MLFSIDPAVFITTNINDNLKVLIYIEISPRSSTIDDTSFSIKFSTSINTSISTKTSLSTNEQHLVFF
jgi:hypothetical protein